MLFAGFVCSVGTKRLWPTTNNTDPKTTQKSQKAEEREKKGKVHGGTYVRLRNWVMRHATKKTNLPAERLLSETF